MKVDRGKLDRLSMERAVYSSLGRPSNRVEVGPGRGLDNAVLKIGGGRLMLITTDPVSIIPRAGIERSAWLSVHLIASDYTTSGLSPEYATFNFNMPRGMDRSDVESYLKCIGTECNRLGTSIVGGHTGSYPGGGYTVVGGGSMFGFCRKGELVTPKMAREGDAILMTKGAAIEAAAMLALSFPRFVRKRVGTKLHERARQLLSQCSTVSDALASSSFGLGRGGVTAMHDATEGGILGGLEEMADASGKAFAVTKERIYVSPESDAVCSAFEIDPMTSDSEGTLLLTCSNGASEALARMLSMRGIPACIIGKVRKGRGLWVSSGGRPPRRTRPMKGGYWRAYDHAILSGLR